MKLIIPRRHVRPGDILIDAIGRPYFQVESVHPARAKGYVVFFGRNLTPRDGVSAGGYKNDAIPVERLS